jgi:hypothetical protein
MRSCAPFCSGWPGTIRSILMPSWIHHSDNLESLARPGDPSGRRYDRERDASIRPRAVVFRSPIRRGCPRSFDLRQSLFLYVRYFGAETEGGYQVTGCAHFSAVVAAWLAWLPLPEAIFGRTFGKWVFDLRVVDSSGRAASAGQAFLRRLLDPIDLLFFFGLVAFVVAKTNAQGQRVGDLIAKTQVIDVLTTGNAGSR